MFNIMARETAFLFCFIELCFKLDFIRYKIFKLIKCKHENLNRLESQQSYWFSPVE